MCGFRTFVPRTRTSEYCFDVFPRCSPRSRTLGVIICGILRLLVLSAASLFSRPAYAKLPREFSTSSSILLVLSPSPYHAGSAAIHLSPLLAASVFLHRTHSPSPTILRGIYVSRSDNFYLLVPRLLNSPTLPPFFGTFAQRLLCSTLVSW